jgi:ribA/ribD-fused uncharacterized protein
MPILKFQDEYKWLSNFAPVEIEYGGMLFPSTENAYQACKSNSLEHATKCSLCAPNISKRLGKICKQRKDWLDIRMKVMYDLTMLKYKHVEFAIQLINIGEQEIVEGNMWHDNFWGNCMCPKCSGFKGENNLGKIIMNVRKEIIWKKIC